MKKNIIAKTVAFLALFGIIIGIVGTGILIIFSGNNTNNNIDNSQTMTQEDLQNIINKSKNNTILTGTTITSSGTKDLKNIINKNTNIGTGIVSTNTNIGTGILNNK